MFLRKFFNLRRYSFWNDVTDLKYIKKCMTKVHKDYAEIIWDEMRQSKKLRKDMLNNLRNDFNYPLYRALRKIRRGS